MAVADQQITDRWAIYNGDSAEVMRAIPDGKVHLSVYSPPFGGLYNYSSSDRDLSNCADYDEFMAHYAYFVRELARITMPGRMTAVHCMDVPTGNSGCDALIDFPGDIIRLHHATGWHYVARYAVWKEPLRVRMRTLAKGLAHRTVIEDSSRCSNAAADYVLVFRRKGDNPVPIEHPRGFMEYAGARKMPAHIQRFRGESRHLLNQYSHWIWRQYASAFWDDVRLERVLPFLPSREEQDEKHVHPLQLDVIERIVHLWSNPGETVLTPFMGVGSEVFAAVRLGRRGVGIELKASYYRQAVKNLATVDAPLPDDRQGQLFVGSGSDMMDEETEDDRAAQTVRSAGTFCGGGGDAVKQSEKAPAAKRRGRKMSP